MSDMLLGEKNIAAVSKNKTRISLLGRIKAFFVEPPAIDQIKDPKLIKKLYSLWRVKIFVFMYLSYVVFYLCRKNISVALVPMGKEFHMTNTSLGILGSALYITYAVGKFVNGVLADRANIRVFAPLALSLSGIANIALAIVSASIAATQDTVFGFPSVVVLLWALAFIWGFNGWAQSGGFPPAAKTLTYWFSNKERGTKWSLWSTSHEIGSYLSVIFAGYLVIHYGWRSSFYVLGIFAIIFSIVLFFNLKDKPSSMGLPEIEEYHNNNTKQEEDNSTKFFQRKKHFHGFKSSKSM